MPKGRGLRCRDTVPELPLELGPEQNSGDGDKDDDGNNAGVYFVVMEYKSLSV